MATAKQIEKQLAAIEHKLSRLVHSPTPGYFALSPSKIKALRARKRKLEEAYTKAIGGTYGHARYNNPQMALFKSPAAAKRYAAAHGLRVKSIRKVATR